MRRVCFLNREWICWMKKRNNQIFMPQAPEIKRLVLHFVCILNIDQSLRRNKKLQKSEDNIL